MEENKTKFTAQIEFVDDPNIAEAAIADNPFFQWAKIVVTDDKPNLNKQRIPLDEFGNLIKSGLYTPIKMSFSEISKGHKEAMGKVIGTITQLTQDNDKLIALAAFWKKERPEDLEMLKDMYTKNMPPNVSWEVAFSESKFDEEGIETLIGDKLTGLTIVSNPAYGGRTPFIAMSSAETEEDDLVEELEEYKSKVTQLEKELSDIKASMAEKETALAELQEYKTKIEEAKAADEKFVAIKDKFKNAGIEKPEEYFVTNKEKFLGMKDSDIDFMIQELIAFKNASASTDTTNPKVPNLRGNTPQEKLSPKELGKLLRENK